jgi:hypothetical protein
MDPPFFIFLNNPSSYQVLDPIRKVALQVNMKSGNELFCFFQLHIKQIIYYWMSVFLELIFFHLLAEIQD